jgi:Flp pilus assembly protein TadD
MTQMTLHQALELGWRELQADHLSEAESVCRQILAAIPQNSDALSLLGLILARLGRYDDALEVSRRAIEIYPAGAAYYCRLGGILTELDRLEEAVATYRKGIAAQRDYVDLHNDLGNALKQLGDIDGAMQSYRHAIDIAPQSPIPHHNLGLVHLLKGHFKQGFAEYAWRWRVPTLKLFNQQFPQPVWDGGDLKGRTILLRAEQGFGDAIHFCRYVPLVAGRGAKVIFACKPPLVRLMRTLRGYEMLATQGDPLVPFDVHATLMDLPGLMGTTLETVPADVPYLSADPTLVATWRRRLAGVPGKKVGLSWAGAREHHNDRNRSLKLSALAPLSQIEGVSLVSLQVGSAAAELPGVSSVMKIVDHASHLTDFAETAALIENLDLVITVDTSVAHLAGAMGKPVWVMLPYVPDWRWMLDREDSPWYPTMRLLRQTRQRNWDQVIVGIIQNLKQFKDA